MVACLHTCQAMLQFQSLIVGPIKVSVFFHVIRAITVIILNLSFLKGARTNEGGFAYKLNLAVWGTHSRSARQTGKAVRCYRGAGFADTLLCGPLLMTL